jgi:uroporphyrinogen decarboxylase
MRQAGRYLPEYRERRGDRDILEACREPELAVELTLQPLRRMDVDAAILFSDIMVPLHAVGVDVQVDPGRGPLVGTPVRTSSDVRALRVLEPEEDEPYVVEAVRLLRKELRAPLIGFAGAPFTLASYLVEGAPSRNHERTKALMLGDPSTWAALMDRLTGIALEHLGAQVRAGAQAIQLFDSWVGALSSPDYRAHVLPAMKRLFGALGELGVPTIHFGVGAGHLLRDMREAGGDVFGLDWRVTIEQGWSVLGPGVGVQGNLDPAAVLAPWEVVEDKARRVLASAAMRDGHVFNLGHGVLPGTDPGVLRRLVDLVHEETAR